MNESLIPNPESESRALLIDFTRCATAYLAAAFYRDDFSDDDTDYIPAATRCLDIAASTLLNFDDPAPCFDLIDALRIAHPDDFIIDFKNDLITCDFPNPLTDLIDPLN